MWTPDRKWGRQTGKKKKQDLLQNGDARQKIEKGEDEDRRN